MGLPRVVLMGCGYGAVGAMRALQGRAEVVGINPYPYIVNSGMSTRLLSGRFGTELVKIPLADHAVQSGAQLILGQVTRIDPQERQINIQTESGSQRLTYDYGLLNVGRQVATAGIPGVDRWAFPVRPMQRLLQAHEHIKTCWHRVAQGEGIPGLLTFVVVGGGCTGVELMGELADLCRILSRETGIPMQNATLLLITSGEVLALGQSQRFQEMVERALVKQGIQVWKRCRVQACEVDGVTVGDTTTDEIQSVTTHTVLWAGGLQVPGWLKESGLPVATDGSVRVDPSLKVVGSDHLLAMGDCAYFERQPGVMLPKIGVYAVRQAPIAAQNLLNLVENNPLVAYHPQKNVFVSVTVGHRRAVMEKGSLVHQSYGATLLKNFFDWLYMRSIKSVKWREFFY